MANEDRIAFLSQPLHGVKPEEAQARFKELSEYLLQRGFKKVIGTEAKASLEEREKEEKMPAKANPRIYYLGKSISMMAEATALVLAPAWFAANGCVVEETVAKQYGLEVFYLKKDANGWMLLKDQKAC